MKKSVVIVLISTFIGLIVIGGGILLFMKTTQSSQEEKQDVMEKKIKDAEFEIDEFYKWNYIGVKSTKVGKLWENPASGEPELDFEIFLDSGKKIESTIHWNNNAELNLSPFGKNVKVRPEIKVKESGEYSNNYYDYVLYPKDIAKLKKSGFTEKITEAEIKSYLFKNYPEKFESDDR